MSVNESLRDIVINNIKTKIQYGELEPTEIITEAQICDELNISRTPAREALIQLVGDGILKKIPRKGYEVQKFDTKVKLNLYEIIAVLDAFAATLAINNITDSDILKMHEYVDKIELAIKYKNYSDYYQYQDRFHYVYINKCNNPLLIKMIKEMDSIPIHRSYISSDTNKLFEVLQSSNDEHREIIKLFENKNVEELEKFLRFTHWATKYPDMI